MKEKRIETKRLILRRYSLMDKNDLLELMKQRVEEVFEGYSWFEEEMIDEQLNERINNKEFIAVELKENHKLIGNIYLGERNNNTKELGYCFNKDYLNKGYGTEASKAIVMEAFENGTHRIYSECNPLNIPSWKVMEKIGMRREGRLIENISFKNDKNGNPIYEDTFIYAILRGEFNK